MQRSPGSPSLPLVEQQTGQRSPSNPIPYIIVPVALVIIVIIVICVMIYFCIRPFHRSNDCIDYQSHEQ
ncbi:hypothetical protein BBBOND_0300250 [Babesia bigemina]|uniref:Uncharacterized protein n=1 Tax=Babesia bigemina TaxID=5866 RepID=A0A061DDB2_BABBI|nr:hypothetical protein BBBOND_0300250 [Babesia bigemina]CDR96120.1 hypothetical protein BBBOND_0300250 [Babesia bigemina]|eukprot:XP_012768306.1 hypothetical protein BBBOND_0300250 [Babesia bigemina]